MDLSTPASEQELQDLANRLRNVVSILLFLLYFTPSNETCEIEIEKELVQGFSDVWFAGILGKKHSTICGSQRSAVSV